MKEKLLLEDALRLWKTVVGRLHEMRVASIVSVGGSRAAFTDILASCGMPEWVPLL